MKKKKKPSSTATASESTTSSASGWTFLTNHSHVLLCLFKDPESTLREVAGLVGITERMVQKIVSELVDGGFLEVSKQGRRNTYRIELNRPLRHPLESHRLIGELLKHLKHGSD